MYLFNYSYYLFSYFVLCNAQEESQPYVDGKMILGLEMAARASAPLNASPGVKHVLPLIHQTWLGNPL
jgi:hypothetical protein